jgi:small subunit ribosomal protein S2
MSLITLNEMFAAKAHFGHQVSRWNPKMLKYIFLSRKGIHVFDLRKTAILLNKANDFVYNTLKKGNKILFVGTKKQAKNILFNICYKHKIFFIYNRWLGGLLTNFSTIKKSIQRMKKLRALLANQVIDKLSKKEIAFLNKDLEKLKKNFIGITNMNTLPDALFVIDPFYENNAVKEANILNIPVIALIDTDGDPDKIAYPIPANDDSIKSISFFLQSIVDSYLKGENSFLKKNNKKGDS